MEYFSKISVLKQTHLITTVRSVRCIFAYPNFLDYLNIMLGIAWGHSGIISWKARVTIHPQANKTYKIYVEFFLICL